MWTEAGVYRSVGSQKRCELWDGLRIHNLTDLSRHSSHTKLLEHQYIAFLDLFSVLILSGGRTACINNH